MLLSAISEPNALSGSLTFFQCTRTTVCVNRGETSQHFIEDGVELCQKHLRTGRAVTLGALMPADRHYFRGESTASLLESQHLNYYIKAIQTLTLSNEQDTSCVLVGIGGGWTS